MGKTDKPYYHILANILKAYPFPSQAAVKMHKTTGCKKCRQNSLANAVKEMYNKKSNINRAYFSNFIKSAGGYCNGRAFDKRGIRLPPPP